MERGALLARIEYDGEVHFPAAASDRQVDLLPGLFGFDGFEEIVGCRDPLAVCGDYQIGRGAIDGLVNKRPLPPADHARTVQSGTFRCSAGGKRGDQQPAVSV